MTQPTAKDLLNDRTGGKSAKFDTIGRTYTGRVLSATSRQHTDYMTNEPGVWNDGSPQLQLVITLATDEREPGDPADDGHRSIYIKWWGVFRDELIKALEASGQAMGSREVEVGATLTATYARDAPSKQGSPTKVIEYVYTPPNKSAVGGMLNGGAAQAPTAAAPPPVTYASTAPPAAPAADPASLVRQLTAAGMTPAQIAAVVHLPVEAVSVLAGMP